MDRDAKAVCANTCRGVSAWLRLRNARGVVGMDPQTDTLADAAGDKSGVIGWDELPYALCRGLQILSCRKWWHSEDF